MPSWKKVITSGSAASLSSITASNGAYFNGNVIITGSLTVGTTSIGVSENTLTLGPRDAGSEGGQIMLQAPGVTYTSASMWDNYANQTRLLRGSNAGSDAVVASFNMHTKQMQLAAYNNVSSFPGTAAAFLAVDSSGNLITTSSAGGGGGSVTINNNVDNYVITGTGTLNTLNGESNLQFNGTSLTITGQITSSGAIISQANGAMYFRGGDDAEFWDINVTNTVGIYGQQDQGVASIKLGSGGGIISGRSGSIGIGTINPTSASLTVNGNVWANSFTGSLQGTATTASYVLQAVSASFATTASYYGGSVTSASYALTASYSNTSTSASYASSASYAPSTPAFPYTGSATVTGSLVITGSLLITGSSTLINQGPTILSGSFKVQGAGDGVVGPFKAIEVDDVNFSRNLYDYNAGSSSIDFGNRSLNSATGQPVISWTGQTGTYSTYLYNYQTIDSITRGKLYSFNTQGGQTLTELYFDVNVLDNDLVYLNTDGIWYQVDQTTDSSTKMLGIAKNIASQTGSVITEGDLVVTTGTGYPLVAGAGYGLPVYIREGQGTNMSVAVPATGYVRLLGHCYYNDGSSTEWIMKFRPSHEWVQI